MGLGGTGGMGATTTAGRGDSSSGAGRMPAPDERLGPMGLLAISAWCGLAAGWLEVGTRMLCRSIDGTNRLYLISRDLVWMVPRANPRLFSGVGLFLAVAATLCPRPARWLGLRLICAGAVLPALIIAGPRISPWAWLIVAAGIAM